MKRIYWIVFSALLVPPLLYPLSAAESGEVKHVLILHSEGTNNPGQQMTEHGIREVLLANQGFDIKLYTEYLDVSRFCTIPQASAMADFLRRKYSGMKIKAIITIFPWAVDFLLAKRSSLFPGVPIIAAVITRRYAENLKKSAARPFITGTIGRRKNHGSDG